MAIKTRSHGKEKIKSIFTVPDYYKDFVCKGGDCRDSCCVEWKVTIPMNQYFLLHGLNCKKSVKDKIDRTFRPFMNPTPERYAEIVHNHNGDCPLHKSNGYCLLHESCGEEALPWVCRYYPRGPRIDLAYEASCANSCEKTLELLFSNDDLIKFEKLDLVFLMDKPKDIIQEERKLLYEKVRNNIFAILLNRPFLLSKRIIHLGIYLKALEINPNIELSDIDFSFEEPKKDINESYQILWEIFDDLYGRYPRLTEQLEGAKSLYINKDVNSTYLLARESFELILPNHEILFEKLLINDIFFKQFPFQKNFSVWDQYIALCGTYLLLRYLAINLMFYKRTKDDFIDIISKSFTVITHSEFDKLISSLYKRKNINNINTLAKIIGI